MMTMDIHKRANHRATRKGTTPNTDVTLELRLLFGNNIDTHLRSKTSKPAVGWQISVSLLSEDSRKLNNRTATPVGIVAYGLLIELTVQTTQFSGTSFAKEVSWASEEAGQFSGGRHLRLERQGCVRRAFGVVCTTRLCYSGTCSTHLITMGCGFAIEVSVQRHRRSIRRCSLDRRTFRQRLKNHLNSFGKCETRSAAILFANVQAVTSGQIRCLNICFRVSD